MVHGSWVARGRVWMREMAMEIDATVENEEEIPA
jgi:hypothetical protein